MYISSRDIAENAIPLPVIQQSDGMLRLAPVDAGDRPEGALIAMLAKGVMPPLSKIEFGGETAAPVDHFVF